MGKCVCRLALQCPVLAILFLYLSHTGSFLQIDSSDGYGDDCLEGECLGTDMCPEKSFRPGVTITKTEVCPTEQSQDRPKVDRAELQSRQLEDLIARQQKQLEHLENLVRKLHDDIHKLEDDVLRHLRKEADVETGSAPIIRSVPVEGEPSVFDYDSISTKTGYHNGGTEHKLSDSARTGNKLHRNEKLTDATITDGVDSSQQATSVGHGHSKGRTVARYKPSWSEHFQFLSVMKIDGEVTCLHVLPQEKDVGLSMYVAVGDEKGRLYIFSSDGDILIEFATISKHPITAMLSFSAGRNETVLVTGHSDGTVLVHRMSETILSEVSHEDDVLALSIEYVQSLVSPAMNEPAKIQMPRELSGLDGKKDPVVDTVTILESYRVGMMRYILVSNADGKIKVFRENGSFYGTAYSSSRPLAFLRSPSTQRLLFLTEDGAASLDLRSMTVRTGLCEGLNGSKVVAYAPDAAARTKGHGFSADGHLIYVALSGDSLHFECHVRSKKKVQLEGPVAPHSIKSYLIVATPAEVFVYNTSLYTYTNLPVGIPRPLFNVAVNEISSTFSINTPLPRSSRPVIASNRDRLVVLGFGDGYIGIYKSNLPVHKSVHFNEKIWSTPVFIAALAVLGVWYFMGKKHDASLGLDANSGAALASSSVTTQGCLRTGLGDQLETVMEPRRFNSSEAFPSTTTGYSSGTIPFRSPSADESFRKSIRRTQIQASTGDPSFRSATVERSSYTATRESPFAKPLQEPLQ